jgi:hypothetical protein
MLRPDAHDGGRLREMPRRIEQTADELNPFLLVIVIGLAILDCTVLAALELPRLSLR